MVSSLRRTIRFDLKFLYKLPGDLASPEAKICPLLPGELAGGGVSYTGKGFDDAENLQFWRVFAMNSGLTPWAVAGLRTHRNPTVLNS